MIVPATVELLDRALLAFGVDGDAARFLAAEGTIAFLAIDEPTVQGWCWGYHLVRPDASSMAYLHYLEVVADWRRRGIGRQLMEAFMTMASWRGASKMFLNTGADNLAARRLYESLGGRPADQGPTISYWFRLSSQPEA